jgi:hypothetical protein
MHFPVGTEAPVAEVVEPQRLVLGVLELPVSVTMAVAVLLVRRQISVLAAGVAGPVLLERTVLRLLVALVARVFLLQSLVPLFRTAAVVVVV